MFSKKNYESILKAKQAFCEVGFIDPEDMPILNRVIYSTMKRNISDAVAIASVLLSVSVNRETGQIYMAPTHVCLKNMAYAKRRFLRKGHRITYRDLFLL